MGRRKWLVLALMILTISSYLISSKMLSFAKSGKMITGAIEYIGDEKCKTCHYKEWSDWKKSDHYKAMLPANDSTVEGNFNNTSYIGDGVRTRFFKKGKEFFINTQGSDGRNHDFKVVYTFGNYPLQQYLIEFPGGRKQATRVSWDAKEKRWFDQYKNKSIPPDDWLHWTRDAQNWNTMCARCHSTNFHKNYSFDSDTFHSTWSVINVSCESCHGAGNLHIEYINSSKYKNGEKVKGSYLNVGGLADQRIQINTCTPCHMRGSEISNEASSQKELLDNYIPEIPTTEHFYADGQVKDEDYTYSSFLQSKMYSRGVKCSNCHNVHSGKLLITGNNLCLQCHSKTYDDISHTFHQLGSEASQCISCHMPGNYYMGNDLRHDHTLRVPRPDLTEKYGTPNACAKCHTDKSPAWAATAINKWYGPKRMYHFSEDLILASKEDAKSEAPIKRLVNDSATPAIIKATALFYLKQIPSAGSLQLLLKELNNPDAQIRYRSLQSLESFSANDWLSLVLPLLNDRVRAVRIEAANLIMALPIEKIPYEYINAFSSAKSEMEKYVLYQADFSTGSIMAGDFYLKQQDYFNAQKFYVLALKKDSLLNYARLNLSTVYNAQGNNDEALKVLKNAAIVTPNNERVFYNLGLLYTEMKDTSEALKSFEKSVQLKSENPRLYYNYGLLLFYTHHGMKAIEMLKRGLIINPRDKDIGDAIKYVMSN